MQFVLFALLNLKARVDEQRQKARERGATAVEYGLLVALIAAVIITTVVTLGTKILAAFDKIVANLP
jgi:pilus assembly protein Flp/PilA